MSDINLEKEKLADELMDCIFGLHRSFSKFTRKKAYTHQQLAVLKMICQNAQDPYMGLKASTISRKFGIAQPSIVPVLNDLEKRGFIQRHADSRDRRVVLVGITRQGEDFLEQHMHKVQEKFYAIVEELGAEDSKTCITLLQKVMTSMQNLNG